MVQIQSSWFPMIDRNPQTFVDIYHAKESDFQKATQRVYHSPQWSTHLVLPIHEVIRANLSGFKEISPRNLTGCLDSISVETLSFFPTLHRQTRTRRYPLTRSPNDIHGQRKHNLCNWFNRIYRHEAGQRIGERGNTVHALTRGTSNKDGLSHGQIRLVTGDIQDRNSLQKGMEGCTQVYHLAAYAKNWSNDPSVFYKQNVEGMRNVFAAAKAVGVKRVVFTSTIVAFGPTPRVSSATKTCRD